MQQIGRHRRTIALAAAAGLMAVACGSDPAPLERMAAQVARLDEVVPIVEELRATDFENSAHCRNLAYARGAFGFLEEDGCERDDTVQFDPVALADHARLAGAIEASGVATDRILVATYDADGDLETAWFRLSDAQLPTTGSISTTRPDVEPKRDVPGRRDFTRIDDDWWFVWSPDD
jgi:hypothetical protein